MYSPADLDGLRAAVSLSPDNLPLRKLLASALLSVNQSVEAEQAYRDALRLSPDDVSLKLGLAAAFRQNRKNAAAVIVLEELMQLPSAEAYFAMAELLADQRQYTEALSHYRQAITLDERLENRSFELGLAQQAAEANQKTESVNGPVPVRAGDDETGAFQLEAERPSINFADVGGMDAVKEEIALKIIFPLTRPELYKAYGKKTGGGILLYGPPGCGKTYLARATAGEIKASFISVGLNDILDMWMGNSERNLHDLFQQARRSAPCVLFFDEVDALGASRNDMRKSAARTVINQFLDELDGVRYSNEGVLVLAATNSPWYLDSAFRRPGRFDRLIFVSPPDASAREQILRLHLRQVPTEAVDVAALAKRSDGYSGADLQAVVDRAVERKLLEALKSGQQIPIRTGDLQDAIKAHHPTVREWFSSAKNYALYANEAGQYEPILAYMKAQKWL
jgi:ATP-dependent 26S proteasome regulatory subunit